MLLRRASSVVRLCSLWARTRASSSRPLPSSPVRNRSFYLSARVFVPGLPSQIRMFLQRNLNHQCGFLHAGSPEEWALTYSVNVLGLFHTLRAFVPVLLEQDVQSAVEVTASVAGVMRGSVGPYGTSKLAALVRIASCSSYSVSAQFSSQEQSFVETCSGQNVRAKLEWVCVFCSRRASPRA